ncbi:MAG TPA: metallophosphoesterase family protein [Bacteroidales bacterium]|nr:metallophosphoesterase family protein [Bacteroidales bacterium]
MTRIGLISDTHGFVDERILNFFKDCDEVWHAGDIGNFETARKFEDFKPFKAVYGNIDNYEVRQLYPKINRFRCEDVDVMMTHIGGYPKRYEPLIKEILKADKPKLFIAGHSHILKVIYDKDMNLLFMNPGAAGNSGFHQVKTAIRFTIDGEQIKDVEIWEAKRG